MSSSFDWARFYASLAALKAGKVARLPTQTVALPLSAVRETRIPAISAEEVRRIATAAAVRRIVGNSNLASLTPTERWQELPERAREMLTNFDGSYVPNDKGNR